MSSESEYNSPASRPTSPEQVESQIAAALNSLERVRNLIDAEVEFVNRRITRSVCRQNSLIKQHVSFYERKSLSNLTTASADCISELPLYQARASQGREVVSAPASPALSESSDSRVSTQSLAEANMSQTEEQQALRRVSTEETQEDLPGFQSSTPQWDLFVNRASVSTEYIEKRARAITQILENDASPPTTLNKKIILNELKNYIEELNLYREEYHSYTMQEQVSYEKMQPINNTLTSLRTDLVGLQMFLESDIPAATQAPPPDMNSQLANMVSAVQSIANAPIVPLPHFAGKITQYAGFKKNFQNLIQKVAGPQTLWASHLVNSLKGDAKKYIGESNKWFDNYQKLWENLDAKYGNRWVLAAESVKALFHKQPPPADDLEAIKTHFFELIDALIALMELGMSLEEVGVIFIIESLPDEHKKELRSGLRALQPGQKTASFTIDNVRNVFNDTIGAETEEKPAPLKGSLSLQTHTVEVKKQQKQVPQTQHQALTSQLNTLSLSNGNRVPDLTGYQTPQTTAQQGRPMWCSLCQGPESLSHYTFRCPNFPTPAEKRLRLQDLGLCPNCCRYQHQGECGTYIKVCRVHGERHYTWLCDTVTQQQQHQQSNTSHQQHQYQHSQQPLQQQYHQFQQPPPQQQYQNFQQPPPQHYQNFQQPPPQHYQNFQQSLPLQQPYQQQQSQQAQPPRQHHQSNNVTQA